MDVSNFNKDLPSGNDWSWQSPEPWCMYSWLLAYVLARSLKISSSSEIGYINNITTSWELWKHPDLVPAGRSVFFKQKWPKESKNGFKSISCRPSPVMIFSKNCFSAKKIVEKIGRFVDFWIFMAIYMDKLDQF